jgi:Resolvase, N terminal domain
VRRAASARITVRGAQARAYHISVPLKRTLATAGVQFVSVTQPMEESPSGKFIGTILAAHGQLDNDTKSEKTTAGMKAAIEHGIWLGIGDLIGRGEASVLAWTLQHPGSEAILDDLIARRCAASLRLIFYSKNCEVALDQRVALA